MTPRPLPPPAPDARLYLPAPEVVEWAQAECIAGDGAIANPDHAHLADADLLAAWTWEENVRKGRLIAATAEIPRPMGGGWSKGRHLDLIQAWAGRAFYDPAPTFLLTFYAPYCEALDDASWCALVEHELYHCAQARDGFGLPRFHRKTGRPIFAIQGHDTEEFVGVVRRYGAGSAAGGVVELVEAAKGTPTVRRASIASACGTCLRKAA
jgi:hypothetical protein